MLSGQLLDWFRPAAVDQAGGDKWSRAIERAQAFLGLLIERQVPIAAGTDVPWTFHAPGHLLWREMGFLTESGMTPLNALRAATSQAARALRRDQLGRLAPGLAADFVVVEGDPTQAIPPRPCVRLVVKAGQQYNPQALLARSRDYCDSFEEEPLARAFKRYFAANPA